MYKPKNQFRPFSIGNQWGQYTDIEENYQDIIYSSFPFSTSKSITIPIPMPNSIRNEYKTLYKNDDYDIEANIKANIKVNIEDDNINDNINHNFTKKNITNIVDKMNACITISIITYVLFFIV